MKQETLALAVGKTQGAISNYESNRNEPPFKVLAEIAAVLGVSPYDLLGQPDPSPVLGSNALPVSFVPVVKSLTPQGSLRDPDNIQTYAPFPTERNEVVGYELPNATSFYRAGDILFLSPKDAYTVQDQVLYLEDERAIVSAYSEVPPALLSSIAGMVVGYYRAV
jgi:transcriptional regulator with XRE-family HTH domain